MYKKGAVKWRANLLSGSYMLPNWYKNHVGENSLILDEVVAQTLYLLDYVADQNFLRSLTNSDRFGNNNGIRLLNKPQRNTPGQEVTRETADNYRRQHVT